MNGGAAGEEIDVETQEESELDAELYEVRDHDAHRHGQSGEINFPKDVGVGVEGFGGLHQAIGEVTPGGHAGEVKQDFGQAVGGELGDVAEDQGEGKGGEQRLDD